MVPIVCLCSVIRVHLHFSLNVFSTEQFTVGKLCNNHSENQIRLEPLRYFLKKDFKHWVENSKVRYHYVSQLATLMHKNLLISKVTKKFLSSRFMDGPPCWFKKGLVPSCQFYWDKIVLQSLLGNNWQFNCHCYRKPF